MDKVKMDFAFFAIAFNIKKMCSKINKKGPIGKVPWLGRPIQSAKYRNYTIEKE